MAKGPPFTDRDVFRRILRSVPTAAGAEYRDLTTIYGDMARLVVAWLATTPPDQLIEMYNEFGWKGTANGRALHEAAKAWLLEYQPDRAARLGVESGT